MALVVKDRVKESTTTTGTGTLTLGGAFAGFQAFSSALSNADTTYYALFESSTGNWEVGLGTFTASGTTLARTTVLASSNSGSAINLTAAAEVFITQPASKAAYFDNSGDLLLTQDPTSNLQAATKQYVDTIAAAGIHYHQPVRCETTANLNATYNNGASGVGATLTNAGTQAALVLDGVSVSATNRVMVQDQTTKAYNGVYTVTTVGSASTNWVLTRATDADSYAPSDPDALGEGDAFFVTEGTVHGGELDVMTTSGVITFGTTNIIFALVSDAPIYTAGNGLTLTGTSFAAGAGTGVTVNANSIAIGQDVGTSSNVTFGQVTAALVGDVTGDVTGDITGNADTATALETARTIGGVSFNGTANISLPGVNTAGNQDTSGTAATATALATGRQISLTGDVTGTSASFNGTGNVSISATIAANSVALGTDTTGNYVNNVTAGALVDISGTAGEGWSPTVAVDLSELTASSSNADGDYFVVLDTSDAQKKLVKGNINVSGFNNDAGYGVGDITGVTAGTYVTGGGTSGTVTVNVDATSANTASKVVARDGSGNFSAGTITAALTGTASNAALLDSYDSSQTESGNTVAVRTSAGYLNANYFNGSGTFSTSGASSGMSNFTGNNGSDNYGRSYNAAAARTLLNVADGANNITNNNQLTNGAGYTTYTANQAVDTTSAPTFGDVYNNGWFRNNAASEGLYNQATGNHWAATSQNTWAAHNGGTFSRIDLQTSGTATRGSIYANNNSQIGFLDKDGNWAIQHIDSASTKFYIDNVVHMDITDTALNLYSGSLRERYVALSGTTPTCNVGLGGMFSLTLTGNTTFSFSNATNDFSAGFILQLTGNGSTVTWPSGVDWAGGTAPDAPGGGETNLYVFVSRDGGTNWIGVLSAAAYA